MKIGNIELKNNIAIAPLAGYTNLAYRKIMKEFGVGLVYTEMISAKGLLYENDKTWELTTVDSNEHPVAVQIFGGEIDDMINLETGILNIGVNNTLNQKYLIFERNYFYENIRINS